MTSSKPSPKRHAARKRRLIATLLIAAFLAASGTFSPTVAAASLHQRGQAPFADSSLDPQPSSYSPSSSASAPPPATPSSLSATHALSQAHKPWLIAAKDAALAKVSSFVYTALPDPRYFSYDIDQFAQSTDESATDSGLFGETAGLNWGGSTLEVIRSQALFLTRAAAFGPRITADDGLKGSLLPISTFYRSPQNGNKPSAHDIQACPYKGGPGWKRQDFLNSFDDPDDRRLYSSFATPEAAHPTEDRDPSLPIPPEDWIALVERGGGCGFAEKVRVAQTLGAIAVVVGDAPSPDWPGDHSGNPDEDGDPGLSGKRLITMYAPGDTSDIRIPSTFVTRPSFLDLSRLIDELEKDEEKWQNAHRDPSGEVDKDPKAPKRLHGLEIVISKDDMMFEWPLIDLGILLLLLPSFMTVATVIVHRIRLIRQRRKERAPELVVLGLPCLIWRSGGQPWEKIEGPDVDPGPGNGGSSADADGAAAASSDTDGQDSPAPVTSITPGDLESGAAAENIPLLQEDENGAGPSRRPTPTVKVPAPPSANRSHSFLPPGRTYFSTDECAICLCDFVDGDRVRVLPCGHIFHRQEIDDWLVRVKKLCPICKRDITVPIPPAPPGPPIHQASGSSSNLEASTTTTSSSAADGEAQQQQQQQQQQTTIQAGSAREDDVPAMERY
ncbi:uncharacterized protein PFL1_04202 [Pseudozyma flocculosa PF-1]|uniref:RING-type domain-containing protein n=2 Tax=Pseudozyma flocculosa TaxID=84751 RepID=A0A5C3EWK4_9BASI|nr:uncharacterized protein PFL1_04202 [Pseudozyma flocculosa PF-1]EPQ28375.1 hypothetical protein PFL1_04202 [Pseudozyma flocculosa PF-1]SPO35529.1 uncharacterized protein PSFLO_01000 [Pseudozyma flocculosa]